MAIEGRLARFVYKSLYRMHVVAVHGWLKGAVLRAVGRVNTITAQVPRIARATISLPLRRHLVIGRRSPRIAFEQIRSNEMTIDLHQLNPSEREVLRLLAEGHTAKSIAAETGFSVGAVNERFREARRKTGVGSSRELARILRSQEYRDKKIGVAGAASRATRRSGAERTLDASRGRREVLIMTGILAIATIGVVAVFGTGTGSHDAVQDEASGNAAAQIASDPMVADRLPPAGGDPRAVYARLRSESRDAMWAERTEAALRERYSQISHISTDADEFRVLCGTTLCEVVGQLPPADDQDAINAAMEEMQGQEMRQALEAAGLKNIMMSFGRDGFIAYWEKEHR
jgi:DNA-binding CsgD family transcriptional regulator